MYVLWFMSTVLKIFIDEDSIIRTSDRSRSFDLQKSPCQLPRARGKRKLVHGKELCIVAGPRYRHVSNDLINLAQFIALTPMNTKYCFCVRCTTDLDANCLLLETRYLKLRRTALLSGTSTFRSPLRLTLTLSPLVTLFRSTGLPLSNS